MITDLKPYPAMKDSGVPWLGEVPGHWDVLPNRAIFSEVNDRDHPEEQMLSVTITKGVLPQRTLLADSSKKDSSKQDKCAYKLVRPGDIAYNKMRAWQGAVGVSTDLGIVSPAYVVQRPRKSSNPRYLHHLLRTPMFAKEAERWSYGITSDMWSLRPEHFRMIYACLPPLTEQAAIVRFLDHADRRIRKYIRAKQKLIKLLEEQKQAIIHQAVTRGLDPTVRLKPSGVEWQGDVPEHWEVRLLGRCLTGIEQGWSPVAAEGELADQQWAVLTLSSVRRGVFDPTAIKPISNDAIVPGRLEVQDGDFLLTRSNTRDRVGDACVVRGVRSKTILCDLIYRLRVKLETMDSSFLMFQLLGPLGRGQIERNARGSSDTMPKISQGHIKSWRVLAPPIDEQRKIVEALAAGLASIHAAIDHATREILLLREYRTRLIADVVTGKLDVRAAAATLSEEAEEPQALDDAEDLPQAAEEEGAYDDEQGATDEP